LAGTRSEERESLQSLGTRLIDRSMVKVHECMVNSTVLLCILSAGPQMTESQDQFAWANKVVPAENPANTTSA
jgi:hypothetical protein